MAAPRADGPPRGGQVLSFRVGDLRLAVAADAVAQVMRPLRITRVPHAPASLAGLANLRGAVIPILSLGRLLDQAASPQAGRIIILDRQPPLGLAVDEVTALATVDGTDHRRGQLLVDEDGSRRLIDLDGLLAAAFRARPAKPGAAAPAMPIARPAAAEAVREVAVLGFALAGQDYALPLEHVREVMALPAELTAVPQMNDALLGVASHRGAYLPIASLAHLLGLRSAAGHAPPHVVVAKIGAVLVGLAVDRLAAVLRAPESAIGPVPALLNRGAGEAQIDAIFRSADGGRLISILSAEHLFKEETTAHILAEGYQSGGPQGEAGRLSDADAAADSERFVIFTLGEEAYGLPIAAVDEVVRLPETLTRVPRAPAFVEGVMNFRGEVIPLIDLRRRFDVVDQEKRGRRRVLVTRIGELRAGFIVDAVSEIADLSSAEMRATPALPGDGAPLFDRVVELAEGRRMILLVDPAAMLDRVETDLLQTLRGAGSSASTP